MAWKELYGCARCGATLSSERVEYCRATHQPYSCFEHEVEVRNYAREHPGKWPDGWWGRSWKITGKNIWICETVSVGRI